MHDLSSILRNIDFASYADDDKLYGIGRNNKQAIESLELASNDLIESFSKNEMRAIRTSSIS